LELYYGIEIILWDKGYKAIEVFWYRSIWGA